MSNKISKDVMISFFQINGYEILDYNFYKTIDKVKLKCKNGHHIEKSYHNIQRGRACQLCAKQKPSSRRHSYEYVYNFFKNNSCELLSKEYKSNMEKLDYICECGNISTINFASFQHGTRCTACQPQRALLNSRTPYEDIKKDIESYNVNLITLEEEYTTTVGNIKIQCECGVIFTTCYKTFKNSNYKCCNNCVGKKMQEDTINKHIDFIKKEYGLDIIKYRTNKYIKYLTIICECGDEYEFTLYSFKKSKHKGLCKKCTGIAANEPMKKYSIEEVRDVLKEYNWELLSKEYHSVDKTMEAICDNGHHTTFTMYRFMEGCRCKQCFVESDTHKKENHWNWKGGITSESELIRKSQEYIKWRNLIYERDNYTCQVCNLKGGNLNAHHILNFSEHEDIRLDLDNGTTICDVCHSQSHKNSFHNIYGTRNNTPEQLSEFIKYKQGEIKLEDLKLNKTK